MIGAVIGYFTNYIAVKMLFRPLKPVRLGKFTLPFTPGIIPRKDKLAEAIGNAVGHNLFTKQDMQNLFQEEKIRNSILGGISAKIENEMNAAIEDVIKQFVNQETLEQKKKTLLI